MVHADLIMQEPGALPVLEGLNKKRSPSEVSGSAPSMGGAVATGGEEEMLRILGNKIDTNKLLQQDVSYNDFISRKLSYLLIVIIYSNLYMHLFNPLRFRRATLTPCYIICVPLDIIN